jgi:hypothetical protein
MHSTNYHLTLITPAPDCPASLARAPDRPGSVADLQYRALAAAPGTLTSDDVIWGTICARRGPAAGDRAAFFARPQACLRASPLVKTLGWALYHDGDGRVSLVDPASPAFAALMADPAVTKRPGMRNSRG